MKKHFMSLFFIFVIMIVSTSGVFAKKLPMMVTDERRTELDKAIGSYAEAWIDDEDFGIKNGKTETGNKHEILYLF